MSLVRLLIDVRRREFRHGAQRLSPWWLLAAGALGLLSAASTLALGVVDYRRSGAGADVLAFVFALWCIGRLAQTALGKGDGALAPEMFRLLPLPRRRLAAALLIVGLVDPGLVVCAVAFAGLVAYGAHYSVVAALVAFVAVALLLVALGLATTVIGGALAPGSRRGRDLSTMVVALAIASVGTAGSVAPIVASTLTGRHSPILRSVVRWLPSGWASVAVDAAARREWWLVLAALAALGGLTVAAVASYPWLLARRMDARAESVHRVGSIRSLRKLGLVPRGPLGAVVAKELRLWTRDQIRLICLIVAVFFGVWPGLISRLTSGHGTLLPFGGVFCALIGAACAVNLYGGDGSSLWCTVVTPGAARVDARGRQLAWLVLFGPFTLGLTLVLTAVSGQRWAWPWVLAGLPALLGGGAALAVMGSLVAVLPLADDGGPSPAWSLKIHVAFLAATVPTFIPAAIVAIGTVSGSDALRWAAVPVGLIIGGALYRLGGEMAARRLERRQVIVLAKVSTY